MLPCRSWTLAVVEVAWRSLASCPRHLWYLKAAHMHPWRSQTAMQIHFRMASLWGAASIFVGSSFPCFLILRSNTDPHKISRIPFYLMHSKAGTGSHYNDCHLLPAFRALSLRTPMFPAPRYFKASREFRIHNLPLWNHLVVYCSSKPNSTVIAIKINDY